VSACPLRCENMRTDAERATCRKSYYKQIEKYGEKFRIKRRQDSKKYYQTAKGKEVGRKSNKKRYLKSRII